MHSPIKCPTSQNKHKVECETMPNVMATLPSRKVWLTPTTGVPCSNAAKTRNLLKLTGARNYQTNLSC